MAKFKFEAKSFDGKDLKGEVEANSEAEARVKLRSQRMTPLRVVPKEIQASVIKKVGLYKTTPKDLQVFTRQLATLLTSGIPVMQAIEALIKSARPSGLNNALNDVVVQISKGKRLAEAMSSHPLIFDRFYVNMVRAGEESGNLDDILNRLAVYIEKSVKIKGKVKGALVYPAVIMVVAFGVIAGILVFVIPKFQQVFQQAGEDLPFLTKMVIAASHFLQDYWWIIIGAMAGAYFAFVNYYRTDEGRKQVDRMMINFPMVGNLVQKDAVARFTRTLSTLLASGVGIMEAIEIGAKVVGNNVIENSLLRARDAIAEGKSIVVPLQKEKYIPQMVTQMIAVGEQTGNLDQMLNKVADFYEEEVDVAVSALMSMIEPLLMVFLGGIIAILVVAMYLPIFNLASAVGGH